MCFRAHEEVRRQLPAVLYFHDSGPECGIQVVTQPGRKHLHSHFPSRRVLSQHSLQLSQGTLGSLPRTLPTAAGLPEASLCLQLGPGAELSFCVCSAVFPAELQPQSLAIILCRDVLTFHESSIFEPSCHQGIREAETGGSQIQGQGELHSKILSQTTSNHRHAYTQEKYIFTDGTF